MIILGYQGIGKSTMAGKQDCIDLESGNFWVNGERCNKWARVYCNIAEHLSNQGYTVFMSSHEVVRDTLEKDINSNLFSGKVYVIYPDLSLKASWITRLKRRFDQSHLEKDYRAYRNAYDMFDENISDLASWSCAERIPITDMNYNLSTIVDQLQVLHHSEVCSYVNEEWRPIKGHEGHYEISNFGRVRSLPVESKITRRGKEELWLRKSKILKPICTTAAGSPYAHLYDLNKNRTSILVKCLVASAFLGYEGSPRNIVNIDGNRYNCRVDNLRIKGKQ